MKKIVFVFAFALSISLNYQLAAQHTEAHKLDKQIEATMDSANHHITAFILNQDTTEYSLAIAEVERAKSMTKQYKALIAKEKGVTGASDSEEAAFLVEEINMYYKPKLKETVMADNKKTEKYKYKGKSYMVGTKSKSLLDGFAEYAPK